MESSGWNLRLIASSSDDVAELARFLSGAIQTSGGSVLTRKSAESGDVEITFEFARAACVEVYSILIAAGLVLSRESHLRIAELCHCTLNLIESVAFETAQITLGMYRELREGGVARHDLVRIEEM
jgi:hypothetical protein